MHITVSLIVDIPASADINEIEQRVQEAGWQARTVQGSGTCAGLSNENEYSAWSFKTGNK